MKTRPVALILACLFSFAARAAVSHDPALEWRTLHTQHFAIHFHQGGEETARKAAAIAERVHARLTQTFTWEPVDRTDIVITDEQDFSNGNATPFPSNRSNLFTAPPDAITGLEDNDGWLESLITHEYTHIVHIDKARGYPRALRQIFGRLINPLPLLNAFPNVTAPTWTIEGLAVHEETDKARGTGRGQSTYFDMLMRMEVMGGFKPIHQVNWNIDTWPGGTTPYLYGSAYYDFIASTRNETQVQALVDQYSDDLVPFLVNTASKRVTGKNLNRMWEDFESYERAKHQPVIEAVRSHGENIGDRLSTTGYQAGSLDSLPDGRVFYAMFDGRNDPALMTYRPGMKRPEKLAELNPGARIDAHPTAGILIAQIEVCRNTHANYDLYRYDLTSSKRTRLTHCARYRHGAWSPDGQRIAAVHHEFGKSRLEVLDAQGHRQEIWWSGANDEVIGDIDWSPNGQSLVAAVWRRTTGWNIEQFTIVDRSWRAFTSDAAIDGQPRYTPDGNAVLFSADNGGVYNVRRIDLLSGEIVTLSNVFGGAFYPAGSDEGFYYIGYGSEGFDLYRMSRVTRSWTPPMAPGASAIVEPDPPMPADMRVTGFDPDTGVRPTWWLPRIEIDEDQFEVGATTSGWDPLQRHLYAASIAYDFENETPVGSLDYIYDRWFPTFKLHASRENDFTRNDDNEVERLRQEDEYRIEAVFPLIRYRDDFSFRIAALTERDSDEIVATGVTPFPDTKDSLLGIAFTYDSTRRYPLSVSRSHGREIRLVAESSDVFDSDFSGQVYTFDWREFIALGREQVLSLRWVEGYGTDTPRPFELGGSDSAADLPGWLDTSSPFNEREYALRGYPEGRADLTGRRMRLLSAEYRFPVWRYERGSMVPLPIALHQLSGAAFVDSGATWFDSVRSDDYRTGLGLEIKADVGLFYSGRLELRLGFAHGFDEGGEDQVYLRGGAAF
jgi:hypothetical protein